MGDVALLLDGGVSHPLATGIDVYPVSAPLASPEPPGPGDPDTPPAPAVPRRHGRRLTLIAARAITHDPITHMGSADIEWFDDPIGLEPSTISATVSQEDPAWALLGGAQVRMGRRSRRLFPDDDGQLEWQVWDERKLVASGVTGQPAALESGLLHITARGPESVLQPRSVGAGGTVDLLGGRGSFPTASLAGWFIGRLATGWTSSTVFDGDRALTVNGYGTVATPWVRVAGAASRWQDIRSAAMVMLPASQAAVFVETQVRLPGGTIVRADITAAGKGQSATHAGKPDWQQVVGSASLPPSTGSYQVCSLITALSSDPIVLDRIVITQDYSTGSIDPLELSDFPPRIMIAAQEPESGGWLGITTRKRSNTGVLRQLSWPHSSTPATLDMLNAVAQTAGGPDLWCDAGWTLNIAARQGRDRRDYALTDDVIIDAVPTWDPAGRHRDLLVLTGWGAGPTRAAIGYRGPAAPGRRRRRREVSAPAELTFREAERWGAAERARSDQRHREIDVTVPYWMGEQLATGDGLLCATAYGRLAELGAVRIANRTFLPKAETCVLTVADDPVVAL